MSSFGQMLDLSWRVLLERGGSTSMEVHDRVIRGNAPACKFLLRKFKFVCLNNLCWKPGLSKQPRESIGISVDVSGKEELLL